MSCTNYRIIEMQNNDIGAVAINGLIPFGNVTRRISTKTGNGVPFEVTSSGADTILLTNKGYYKVIYSASVAVAAAGAITLSLLVNGVSVYSVTTTAGAAGTYNLTLAKELRVFANCASVPANCPASVQIQLTGSAITGGTGNIIIDSCVNG